VKVPFSKKKTVDIMLMKFSWEKKHLLMRSVPGNAFSRRQYILVQKATFTCLLFGSQSG